MSPELINYMSWKILQRDFSPLDCVCSVLQHFRKLVILSVGQVGTKRYAEKHCVSVCVHIHADRTTKMDRGSSFYYVHLSK